MKPAVESAAGLASAPSAKAPPPQPAPPSRRKKWLMRAAALLLLPALLVGGAELLLRVVGYGHPTRFLVPSRTGNGLTVNPWFAQRYFPPRNTGT